MRNLPTWGNYQQREATDPSVYGGNVFRDFLVLEFILMRVLKSGKMIGGQIFCSFFVSDDNIEFLEQKDPPHQSWLSIFLSEEILLSSKVRSVVWLDLHHGFVWHIELLDIACSFVP
ncbi:hypothetical protein Tco_1430104 [Tanacetum coccineum]